MPRRYWVKVDGRKYTQPSVAEAMAFAQRAANFARRGAVVGYDEVKTAAKRLMKRNPVLQGHDFTGEEWKLTARGPNGRTVSAYCETEAQARNEMRVMRANGYRVTHLVRLTAANMPVKAQRRR